ncbi:uncharacterized protein A4U43_C02F3840 [Asparagus officinalis]|uniref:Myb-like protein X n=1 Tax=Asparagus officinalis TaxID=4686 RepID=A0A5P1FGD9_ASPOF|nr:myb-like protein X [Asparagus officinalis]ONK77172.1 uncharacterized protein A4U43_C02F3840 [Asparagus officinalis]
MSRCFPYPPPGFEKKARNNQSSDLLAKEKQKERKHKKEKRDKEKKEGKEKKHKDKNKDKHKEKKDRKERHRDKKRDKEKNKTSDGKRIERWASDHNQQKDEKGEADQMLENATGVVISKAEEANNSKYMEELDRRIEIEKKAAANRMLENSTCSIPKRVEGLGISISKEQRKPDGVSQPMEKANHRHQLSKNHQGLPNGNQMVTKFSKEQRRPDALGQPVDKGNYNHQSLPNRNPMVPNFSKEQGRVNGVIKPVEMFNQKHQALPHRTPAVSNFINTEKRRVDEIPQAEDKVNFNHHALLQTPAEKDEVRSIERKEKGKDGDLDREREEKKKKRKEKNRDKEKEKEEKKKRKKGSGEDSQKENHTRKDTVRDQVNSLNLKPRAPENSIENFDGNYGNSKKRKEIEMNGFLHEYEVPPNKLLRPASSSNQQNGKTFEFHHIHTASPSIRHMTPNNVKAEKVLNNKEHKTNVSLVARPSPADSRPSLAAPKTGAINGTAAAQPPIADLRPEITNGIAVAEPSPADSKPLLHVNNTIKSNKVFTKPSHPDSKFLERVYSIPKIEQLPEFDEQEWLFGGDSRQSKPMEEIEAKETPEVWAQGLKIESADVFALPYVIPY